MVLVSICFNILFFLCNILHNGIIVDIRIAQQNKNYCTNWYELSIQLLYEKMLFITKKKRFYTLEKLKNMSKNCLTELNCQPFLTFSSINCWLSFSQTENIVHWTLNRWSKNVKRIKGFLFLYRLYNIRIECEQCKAMLWRNGSWNTLKPVYHTNESEYKLLECDLWKCYTNLI